MNQSTSLYLSALSQVNWQDCDKFNFPTQISKNWLLEQGSLSRLLAQHCQTLSVDLQHNKFVRAEKLNVQEVELLEREPCLLRKVVLKGDSCPWVLGRTLIPQSSMAGQPFNLEHQGETPLGLTIFSANDVKRDALKVGWAITKYGDFLARRSRLWINQKPILVAELFLPSAPIYDEEIK
ncbi:chorismate lyase [Vibrio pectenicida]|uniref:Probable chorismate pyruvate-lyase n=1 Tax=Vibrio pectenicida TaxID=62763 RepID=A0A427U317_9VIBR|nr:chorismate lyase [Vibrio pectenicida]RSD31015.1 chorismate lyase [Vibrio pectenicida]